MTRKHFIKLAQLINDNVRMANVRNNPMWVLKEKVLCVSFASFYTSRMKILRKENSELHLAKY